MRVVIHASSYIRYIGRTACKIESEAFGMPYRSMEQMRIPVPTMRFEHFFISITRPAPHGQYGALCDETVCLARLDLPSPENFCEFLPL